MTTTTSAAQQMAEDLFSGQLRANISLLLVGLKEEFSLDEGDLLAFSKKHLNGVDYHTILEQTHKKTKGGSKKNRGGPTVRKPKAPPAHQCFGRVWLSGSGADRCSSAAKDGGEWCWRHLAQVTQANGSTKACQRTEAGAKSGLFLGDIRVFQDGEEGVPPYKDEYGKLQIEWSSSDMKARVEEELASESITRLESTKAKAKSGRKKKSSYSPNTVELASASDLASALGVDDTESKSNNEEASLTDMLDTDEVVPTSPTVSGTVVEVDANGDDATESDTDAPPSFVNTPAPDADGDDAAESGTDASNDDSEEGLEVEERDWEGETYAVDPETNIIYDADSGEEIGRWDEESGPVMETSVDSD